MVSADGPGRTEPVPAPHRALHPRHGRHAPRKTAPVRTPGSIRRTSTIDAVRPDGLLGDLVQVGVARDCVTLLDGTARIVGAARLDTVVDYTARFTLREIAASPARPELAGLIGRSVSTGFRAAAEQVTPDEWTRSSLLRLLLDDLPGAALVSGYAIGAAGLAADLPPSTSVLQIADLCSGFRTDGTIMVEIGKSRRPPVVTGPVATALESDDELAWHPMRRLGPHDMRRWRCLDVRPDPAGGLLAVEAYLRDSHADADGLESIIHEYTVTAEVDPSTMSVVSSSATAHTLPWLECIDAEVSARRLAGRSTDGLRVQVREEFTGITTCTHLNDTLRSLEDVAVLWQEFPTI